MLDDIILLVVGILSIGGLTLGALSFRIAMKHARKGDQEMKMISWTILGMGGFIFSAVSFVYFILPILLARYF
ncbi:MAG: hypothetical protein FJ215_10990 [Ignavibacteria bacterium]|nr:hypothetical protein [Ignavibacteria bacterium]